MTAREIAMLARHIIRTYPEYYEFFGLKEFNYSQVQVHQPQSADRAWLPGVDGLKTGFTKEAGYGIVASAKQDNRRLIAVVNGLATADERRDDARRLLEWGFRNFAEAKLYDAGEVVGHARVWGGQRMYVPLAGKGDVNVWLPRNMANQKLRANIVYQWPLKPPLRKGDQVAVLRVTTSSETMNEVPLFVAEDVDQAGTVRRGLRLAAVSGHPVAAVIGPREQEGSCGPHWQSGPAPAMASGKFITFEGGEGSGKSTQARLLADRLKTRGIDAVLTREPGGSPFAERVRALLLDPAAPSHSALSEALLFYAARADHLDKTIRPTLAARALGDLRPLLGFDPRLPGRRRRSGRRGARCAGAAGGGADAATAHLHPRSRRRRTAWRGRALAAPCPAVAPADADPFERRDPQFHERLRAGYLAIAAAEPQRCVLVDGAKAPDTIAAEIWAHVEQRLLRGGS